MVCDSWLTLEGVMMKFRLRRVVTTVAFAIYFTFFLIYVYSTINRDSTKINEFSSTNSKLFSDITKKEEEYKLPLFNSSELKSIITQVNRDSKIRNFNKFGKLPPYATVIIVQVHNRAYYLKELIDSLRNASGISNTLLVFSHDVYNDEINNIISKIDFCRVLQIFYPWSIQLHPKSFPGEDPNDCPRDIKKERALEIGCNNAMYPDLYGHYREAAITQTKHHWWWKINEIMDGLEVTKNHHGLFLFLEEDHYVAKDFLYMLDLMHKTKNKSCPECNILTLGNYAKMKKNNLAHSAEYVPWVSSKHNMGMAMSRETWMLIKSCAQTFCYHDDYNWDWTLQHISVTCLPPPQRLTAMMLRFPRVFHIGECGIHHKGVDCQHSAVVGQVQRTVRAAENYLFPKNLHLLKGSTYSLNYKDPKANGGWGDQRDHQICTKFIHNSEDTPYDRPDGRLVGQL